MLRLICSTTVDSRSPWISLCWTFWTLESGTRGAEVPCFFRLQCLFEVVPTLEVILLCSVASPEPVDPSQLLSPSVYILHHMRMCCQSHCHHLLSFFFLWPLKNTTWACLYCCTEWVQARFGTQAVVFSLWDGEWLFLGDQPPLALFHGVKEATPIFFILQYIYATRGHLNSKSFSFLKVEFWGKRVL